MPFRVSDMQAFRHQPIDACTRSPVPTIDKHTFASMHTRTHPRGLHILAPACKHAGLHTRTHTHTHTHMHKLHMCAFMINILGSNHFIVTVSNTTLGEMQNAARSQLQAFVFIHGRWLYSNEETTQLHTDLLVCA